ncbi:uncharacterized protein N7503_002825 [Penicillium pulvis]|uniref:uncharacterized protein n=1 Tax=Penicillium pulvis TaxID=1562058 RepID=UPI002546F012|nr:uncharacterized protein N7503_002825 [Penicillium pulvis]KAJ5810607.1 hypothetical protein N7503_002825 [Penicillium pulvis]
MSLEAPLTVLYKEINGSKITTDIYLPKTTSSSPLKYPVVIDIHGGAFMLGHSKMVSMPQINDCLERGWIVLVPNHRLCPGVNLLEGPMQDIRDLLTWVYDGHLDAVLAEQGPHRVDVENVAAFGTSSGGHLALGLGFNTPKQPKAIFSLYGAVHFTHPFWKEKLPHVAAKLPPNLEESFLNKIYDEVPVPTDSSVSLEGQSESGASKGPNFSQPRDAFAFTQISSGNVISVIYPPGEPGGSDEGYKLVDPVQNVSAEFPPTYIVHGLADTMVTIDVSRELHKRLSEAGVPCGMTEVPGEEHTFAMMMKVGSKTWWLQREGFDFLEKYIGKGPL